MPAARCLLALILLSCAAGALAQAPPTRPGEFAMCPPNPVLAPVPATSASSAPQPVVIEADRSRARQSGPILLSGDVTVTRGAERFWGRLLHYFPGNEVLTGEGNLRYASPNLTLQADKAHYDFTNDHGIFYDATYQLPARHGRGHAERIDTHASDKTDLTEISYTTCPPKNTDWLLHADKIVLNHDIEIGYAYNAWISFMGVPFLWTPYLSFPLTDRRKSGFLAPTLARNSSGGLDIELPYYFNIAPNLDMTLTPRIVTRRGFMLMDTFRWLFPGTHGKFHAEYMPHDRKANRERSLFRLVNVSQIDSHWQLESRLEYISDPYYLGDFGISLQRVAQTYQTRRIRATYQVGAGAAFIQLVDQTPIDPTIAPAERPYRKLPEIGFLFTWPDYRSGLAPSLYGDFTRFEAPARRGALRSILRPAIRWNLAGPSWFITPLLAFDQANYRLDAFGTSPTEGINRSTPIAMIDAGLRFARRLGDGGWLTQTLEPRINYLYVPYRDQADIPIFDTYLPPIDMERLFAINRFVGADRLGDANRISLGLTSRFLDNRSGAQLFTLGIGQSFYFSDRRVTMPGEPVQTRRSSDLVGQFTANLGHNIHARVVAAYDPYSNDFDQGYLGFQFHPGTYTVLNLGYLYREGALNQTAVSFSLPINSNWSVVGRWNYSLSDNQTLETMAGIQYDTCCWRIRLVTRRFVTLDGQGNSAILLELALKGLGSVGNRLSDFLHDDIYGYGENPHY
ncbi:MAG: LPS assembly protein LptD [Gammaproteobacteria bacterium]|nr:LPS assembly protein LptD [Gammaproteobacteria bacterium]